MVCLMIFILSLVFCLTFFLQEIKKLGLAIQGALKIHSQSIQVRKCSIYWYLNWNIFLTSDLKYTLDIEHKKSYTFDYGTECQQLLQITQTLLFPFKFIFKKTYNNSLTSVQCVSYCTDCL